MKPRLQLLSGDPKPLPLDEKRERARTAAAIQMFALVLLLAVIAAGLQCMVNR